LIVCQSYERGLIHVGGWFTHGIRGRSDGLKNWIKEYFGLLGGFQLEFNIKTIENEVNVRYNIQSLE
jgi:hypothetical protein